MRATRPTRPTGIRFKRPTIVYFLGAPLLLGSRYPFDISRCAGNSKKRRGISDKLIPAKNSFVETGQVFRDSPFVRGNVISQSTTSGEWRAGNGCCNLKLGLRHPIIDFSELFKIDLASVHARNNERHREQTMKLQSRLRYIARATKRE